MTLMVTDIFSFSFSNTIEIDGSALFFCLQASNSFALGLTRAGVPNLFGPEGYFLEAD